MDDSTSELAQTKSVESSTSRPMSSRTQGLPPGVPQTIISPRARRVGSDLLTTPNPPDAAPQTKRTAPVRDAWANDARADHRAPACTTGEDDRCAAQAGRRALMIFSSVHTLRLGPFHHPHHRSKPSCPLFGGKAIRRRPPHHFSHRSSERPASPLPAHATRLDPPDRTGAEAEDVLHDRAAHEWLHWALHAVAAVREGVGGLHGR